ncbi:uncharacterized protein [Coffea arabica]|uniref:Retrotransposon gag domain-containing protein n=1 Tax=Coffea arabica TaxID=13443 RepID=A0ABM4VQK9_COFAR
MANNRTLRESAVPDLTQLPLCEEPPKHLQEFDIVCSSMKPPGVTEKLIKLREFPFSLKDSAKDWLYYLPAGSIITWAQLKNKFLKKYFPASRVASLRKEICGVKQQLRETLNIIDAASGGALVNKTPGEAWELIERMVKNSQQFDSRDTLPTRNEQQTKVCGIYTNIGHSTDMCQMIQEENAEQVSIVGNMPAPWRQLEKPRKPDKEKEILEMFKKVEINIPLLDAIKRKLKGDERIVVGENVSTVLQRKLSPKCGDPDIFTIPCKIGNTNIRNAMLNLGASINVMPNAIYASLNLAPLKETGIIIQLANRTNA